MSVVAQEPLVPGRMADAYLANESMYLWWHDPEREITGVQRLAHQPNNNGTGRAEIWHAILTADGRRYRRGDKVAYRPEWRDGAAFRVEGLEFALGRERSTIGYADDSCRMAVEFTDLHAPVDWAHADKEEGRETEATMFAGHVEVGGSIRGQVVLDGEEIEISGLGYRDHSWGGQRDMRPMRCTSWVNGTVGPELTFGVMWISMNSGDVVEGGFVVRDGEMTAVTEIDLTVGLDVDSICWRRGSLRMGCADGSRVEVEYREPFDAVIFESGDWLVCDGPTRITVDGVPGSGTMEVAANPRGGLEFPRTIRRACARDGLTTRR